MDPLDNDFDDLYSLDPYGAIADLDQKLPQLDLEGTNSQYATTPGTGPDRFVRLLLCHLCIFCEKGCG